MTTQQTKLTPYMVRAVYQTSAVTTEVAAALLTNLARVAGERWSDQARPLKEAGVISGKCRRSMDFALDNSRSQTSFGTVEDVSAPLPYPPYIVAEVVLMTTNAGSIINTLDQWVSGSVREVMETLLVQAAAESMLPGIARTDSFILQPSLVAITTDELSQDEFEKATKTFTFGYPTTDSVRIILDAVDEALGITGENQGAGTYTAADEARYEQMQAEYARVRQEATRNASLWSKLGRR